jgi:glycosyltransferase involved in cell wall biosynthesis
MKVCHVTSVHPHTDTRIFVKECCTLAMAGHDTHLVAAGAPDEVRSGVRLHGVAPGAGGRLSRMTGTARKVVRRARALDADVYHFHDPELLPFALGLRRAGKRVIYDVHEDLPRDILSKTWIPAALRGAVARGVEACEDYAARRFDCVIAATPFIRERFLRRGARADVVNNYPILGELAVPHESGARREHAVAYVGEITALRGAVEMVQAIGATDAKLLLGGRFEDAGLRQRVMNLPGWGRVEELGQLARPAVAGTFARARAGLVLLHPAPNHTHAQPNKMFEYMSAGLPLIGSDFPLWREIIEGNACGLCVDPLDPGAIAGAIRWILAHPDEAARMGENGRRAVLEKYNWDAEGARLLSIYEALDG